MPNHHDQYRISRLGGSPVFAIPVARRRVRLAAARRFQADSWKRAAFQRAIRGAIVAGVDRWLWPAADGPFDDSADKESTHKKSVKFNFSGWLNDLRGVLEEPTAVAAVVWPPQADRGRVYVHLLAASGDPVAFAKISFDAANDHCLNVEAETLRQLQSLSLSQCHPPALLAESTHNGHRYVVVEPLPENARPVEQSWRSYPSDCVVQYAGQHERLTAEKVADLDWWKAYQHGSSVGTDAFRQELNNAIQDGLDVCRVHGDLGPGNLVLESNPRRLWLFDWENSHPRGPKLTDRVNFFIAISQATILSDPIRGLRELAAHFFSADPRFARKDVLAALAYLHTVDIRGATALIQQWDRLPT